MTVAAARRPVAAGKAVFATGNEMAVEAARQIDFHLMGYFPITPSTEIAEGLDALKAQGKIRTVMIPGDGEHAAAGMCYGASWSGGRVLNATSAQGLLFGLEQYPVQSGTRRPMLLYLATRSVSGPLDIKCDHSDLAYALETGWIVVYAKDPQAVYDLSFVALKTAEDPAVRLPAIVAFDGFFTSHQRRRGTILDDAAARAFIGAPPEAPTLVEPDRPITAGAYMNEPDLLNNKYQQRLAMEAAAHLLDENLRAFGAISGRPLRSVEAYRLEDAETAIVIVGSSFDTACEAVDRLRDRGLRVGALMPVALRPFPAGRIREALGGVRTAIVCDRADTPGAEGGRLAIEVRAALQVDPANRTRVLARVYGLGGRDFTLDDAEYLLREAARPGAPIFGYHGAYAGDSTAPPGLKVAPAAPHTAAPEVEATEGGRRVKGLNLRNLTLAPRRVLPGHAACPGCGIYPTLNLLLKGIGGHVVLLFQTGCAEITSSCYPSSAFATSFLHNLFQNGAPTLAGLMEAYEERRRRGEIPGRDDLTFVMVSGDGGMDIGLGPSLAAAIRNHRLILVEYDNGGYMNTGHQGSTATPFGVVTTTTHAGKATFPRDSAALFAAAEAPYVATVAESHPKDFVEKAAKAAATVRDPNGGLAFLRALSACPLHWGCEPRDGIRVVDLAVRSAYFPLYEVDRGRTRITYDPDGKRKVPLAEYLGATARTRHLLRPEHAEALAAAQAEVDRRWQRLQERHRNPVL